MEPVNDQGKILRDLVEAAMGAVEASGQVPATTSNPLAAVTAVLEATGVTGVVTEAAAGVLTNAVSKICLFLCNFFFFFKVWINTQPCFSFLLGIVIGTIAIHTLPSLPVKQKGMWVGGCKNLSFVKMKSCVY